MTNLVEEVAEKLREKLRKENGDYAWEDAGVEDIIRAIEELGYRIVKPDNVTREMSDAGEEIIAFETSEFNFGNYILN